MTPYISEPTKELPQVEVASPLHLPQLKGQLQAFNEQQAKAFVGIEEVNELIFERAGFMDALLTKIWQQLGLADVNDLSLVAVGGYGRGELHPKSDIDLLILSRDLLAESTQSAISEFITLLWDLRLEVGQSVRTVDDCIHLGLEDITIATNLIESRLICGNNTVFVELKHRLHKSDFWPSQTFFRAKRDEQSERHSHYLDNGYSLEPDIKSNPGGLRDLHTIYWVARRHFGAANLLEMTVENYLTQEEYRELSECQNFLWKIRFALHLVTKRADNRLLFDFQADVAEKLGFEGKGYEAVENMMKEFYRTIRRVSELNEMLLQHFEESILGHDEAQGQDIDEHFQLKGKLINLKTPGLFFQQPETILDLFLHMADNPQIKGVYATTLREIRESRRRLTYWLQDFPACRTKFIALLKHPRGMGRPLTLMHKYGILAAYIPEWSKILGQMQFDLFHAYTVDEHTHRLIKYIYRYPTEKSRQVHPICGEIFPTIKKPELLFLGAIFHDIAKGRRGDHSELGAIDAKEFCLLHDFSEKEAELVSWLVKNHLVMSVTAQRRDIQDPEVVSEFAAIVKTKERLNNLLLLTVADICATNDDVWNSWKGALLKDLYYQTLNHIQQGHDQPVSVRSIIRQNKQAALDKLLSKAFCHSTIENLWRRFKADYFLRHTPAQIAWHCEYIIIHNDDPKPLVLISKNATRGGTEIFVYSKDDHSLFATVVTELTNKNLNIHDATILTSKDGFTLDTFVVLEPDGSPVAVDRTQQIKPAIVKALLDPTSQVRRVPRMSRQMRQFSVKTQVNFLPDRNRRTELELTAFDAPGLLAKISEIFQQANLVLHNAKITTIGEQVEDLFILTTQENQALDCDEKAALSKALYQALDNVTTKG